MICRYEYFTLIVFSEYEIPTYSLFYEKITLRLFLHRLNKLSHNLWQTDFQQMNQAEYNFHK